MPAFHPGLLAMMAFSGIIGSMIGRLLNKKIRSETVNILFRILMIIIIGINIYNIVGFS